MIDNEESEWYSTLSQEVLQKLDKLLQSNFPEFLKTLITDTSLNNFMNAYLKFQDEIRDGKHGKNTKLWLSYMDHATLVFALQEAVQDNNYLLYVYVLILWLFCFLLTMARIMLDTSPFFQYF